VKHVVVSIPYGLAFRNLACCGVLHRLAEEGARLTVLMPPASAGDRARLAAELPTGARVEALHMIPSRKRELLLKFLKQHFYGERTGLESFAIKKRARRRETPVVHVFASLVEQLAGRLVSERQVDRWLVDATYPFEDDYRRSFREWRPDVVAVTKPGYHPEELPLLKAARTMGIPTISVDTTWDNMVSKRPPYILPDAATVWNAEMSDQAAHFYQMRPNAISVTGGPQFDTFFRVPDVDRIDALRQLNLDPARPLVIFALSNPAFTAGTLEFAHGFAEQFARGRVAGRPNVVLRRHPWDRTANAYAGGVEYEPLRVEHPFDAPETGTTFECLPTRRAVERQGLLYRVADVIVNTASTSSLDGIAADVPVVNIAFDAVAAPHPDLSVARFSNYTHYRPILESGAVRVARSWDELCSEINASLGARSRDAASRERARQQFLGFSDPAAFGRVARAILTCSPS
jgi:hypothetical protein